MITGYAIEVMLYPGVWTYVDTVYPKRKRIHDPDTGQIGMKYLGYLRGVAIEKAKKLNGMVVPLGTLTDEENLIELEAIRNA